MPPWQTTAAAHAGRASRRNSMTKARIAFLSQEADEDGSGELDIDEFVEKLGPHLGGNLTVAQIRQLFLKIDADAGGTVDW